MQEGNPLFDMLKGFMGQANPATLVPTIIQSSSKVAQLYTVALKLVSLGGEVPSVIPETIERIHDNVNNFRGRDGILMILRDQLNLQHDALESLYEVVKQKDRVKQQALAKTHLDRLVKGHQDLAEKLKKSCEEDLAECDECESTSCNAKKKIPVNAHSKN
jgi:hypothetical protein